ncbi:phospho-N-acetylmuramoyl-pentapeptide-transferase [Nakamurella sp. YIM 132087]|uniref:Phospho-N-acetylmuramoyl-pentapeptide-transferase n=1 Tax=Nakamurella alba TaxID=2665158 RepID=A0A7K1FTL5_9ACTN|nr:phospho-N-acetylmuramoyl-pentapeptide-transferase [Nakamurella alba]MTD16513.1 phospho-N-acetylmuramoyl-pentapeptide-transferase [Nakamurella alba]
MKSILIAAIVGLVVSILLTPYLIKVFSRQGFGQEIRDDGPQTHLKKRGTPTMGGTAIIIAMWVGYVVSTVVQMIGGGNGPTASGWLLLYLTTGLGVVGMLDDFIKIRKQRSLGLNKRAKLIGQTFIAVSFGVLALMFRSVGGVRNDGTPYAGLTPASTHLSYTRDIPWISLGAVGFVIFAVLVIAAWSNAVNFTDGLDGLAAGSSVMVLGVYVFIGFYQFRNACANVDLTGIAAQGCYEVRDPLDIAVVTAAALGGCIGFLWWNAHPARIFMGDSGSLALGGLVAGLSILTRTEMLMIVIAGLAVVEMLSVVLQMLVYKARKVRIFKMAPFHHHFEVGGWTETTVMVRFWLLAAMSAALGAALFYADWLANTGG